MYIIFYLLILIPSAIFHEYMHGWVANQLGDPTARYAGRLTLDPRVHVDIFGSFLLPLSLYMLSGGNFLFAYAKPVPYNPYNLRDQRWGPVYVALAGPLSNLAIAFVFGMLLRVPAFDAFASFFGLIVYANVVLAIFNLVPIPPLDGSKLLYAFMPASWNRLKMTLERYGFVMVLLFVFFFSQLLSPIVNGVFALITKGLPL